MNSKSAAARTRAKQISLLPLVDHLARRYENDPARPISGAAYRAGALVRMMRKSQKLSQAELGRLISVSQARISEIETGIGVQGPTWELMERIAFACDATILLRSRSSEIFGNEAAESAEAPAWEAIAER